MTFLDIVIELAQICEDIGYELDAENSDCPGSIASNASLLIRQLEHLRRNAMIHPLSDRVIVRRTEAETTSAGGIVIPDAAQKKARKGVVVAVGPGRLTEAGVRIEPSVAKGDRVLFGDYAGDEIKLANLDGEDGEYLVLREGDILGIIEDER